MDQIIQWLLSTDTSTITSYINYFFIALAAVGIIGFIVGLCRGMYRSLCYELCLTICIIIIICCCGKITSLVYDADLSGIDAVANLIPGETKKIGVFVENKISEMIISQGITITNQAEFNATVTTVALSITSIVVYFVLFLLSIVVVAPLLHLLVYNLIFRLLIPKNVRKKHKLRLVGAALTTIEFVVVFALFLSPLTGIVNSVTGKMRDESGKITKKESDNDQYNAFYNAIDAYNKSAVSQMFFTLSFEKNKSFDVSLMDQITRNTLLGSDEPLALYSELGGAGALFISALGTGAFGSEFNPSLLLVPEFIEEVFAYIGNSVLINTVLALGVSIIANSSNVKDVVDLSSIDFFSVDWSSVTSALNTSYSALYDGGVFDTILNLEEGENPLDKLYIDGSNASYYKTAFKELGNNELVSTIMPKLFCSFAKKKTNEIKMKRANEGEKTNILDSFELPSEENFYSDIRWGDELASLVDVFANISDQYNAYYDERLSISKYGDAFTNEPLKFLLGQDTVKTYEKLEDKYNKNVFIAGGKYKEKEVPGINAIIGVTSSNPDKGLLDLQIVKKIVDETDNMQNFISSIDVSNLIKTEADSIKIEQSLDEVKALTKNWKILNWKSEFKALINSLLPIIDMSKEIDNIFGLGENIEYTFTTIDDSSILKTLLPPLLESLLGDALKVGDKKINPNFNNIESWGYEGIYLHKLLDSINEIATNGFASIDWSKIDNITTEEYEKAALEGYKGTFDDYYIDNSKVYKVLKSLYETQSIGGSYKENGDRENGVFEEVLKSVLFEALKAFDNSLDIKNTPENELIDKDLSLGDKVVYSTIGGKTIYVSWISINEGDYRGELANLALMMSELSSFDPNKMSSIEGLLNRANESYILRNVVMLLLDNLSSNGLDDGIAKEFIDRADFDVFHQKELSMTPYEYIVKDGKKVIKCTDDIVLQTRKEEINARRNEFDSLIDVFECLDDVSNALDAKKDDDSFYAVKKLTANKVLTSSLLEDDDLKTSKDQSPLERITSLLCNSKIFNNPKYDDSHNRIGTTSFEYLFQYITSGETIDVSDFLINLKTNPEIIYEITEKNKWEEEISGFNRSLYEIVNNDLINIMSNSSDFLGDINALISDSKEPIQNLFASMHKSMIIDNSIGYALDNQFIPKIIENFETSDYYVENKIYEIAKDYYESQDTKVLKSTLSSFNVPSSLISQVDKDKMGAFWKNEAASLEELISAIVALDFENMAIDSTSSIDISLITNAIEHSLCLNYLDNESHIVDSPQLNERSIYQLTIINIVDKINSGLYSAIGLDTSISNSSLIKDRSRYKQEAKILNSIIESFQELNKFVVDGNIKLTDENASSISVIFKKFTKCLNESHVYHYINNEVREGDKLSIFEQVISKILVTAGLDKSIYNSHNPSHSSYSNGREVIEGKIRELSRNDLENAGDARIKWFATGTEIDKLCKIIDNFSSFKFNSSIDDLSSYINCSDGVYSGILVDVNNSYLLHDLVSTMIKEFVIKINIDDLDHQIGTPGYNGMLIKSGKSIGYYSIDDEDIQFGEKVNKWNKEMHTLSSLLDEVKKIQDSGDNILACGLDKPFETVLSKLSTTNLFSSVIDQITISLLHDYTKVTISLGETKSYYIASFLYMNKTKAEGYDLIDEYLKTSYGVNPYDWALEGKGIDQFINGLNDFVNDYMIYKLYGGTYPTWNNTVYGFLEARMVQEENLKYNFN